MYYLRYNSIDSNHFSRLDGDFNSCWNFDNICNLHWYSYNFIDKNFNLLNFLYHIFGLDYNLSLHWNLDELFLEVWDLISTDFVFSLREYLFDHPFNLYCSTWCLNHNLHYFFTLAINILDERIYMGHRHKLLFDNGVWYGHLNRFDYLLHQFDLDMVLYFEWYHFLCNNFDRDLFPFYYNTWLLLDILDANRFCMDFIGNYFISINKLRDFNFLNHIMRDLYLLNSFNHVWNLL